MFRFKLCFDVEAVVTLVESRNESRVRQRARLPGIAKQGPRLPMSYQFRGHRSVRANLDF
jgi:hypothetical protein